MGAVPKKMVTIFGRRVPASALVYLFIIILLSTSLLLPWVYLRIDFPEPTIKLLAVDGTITLIGYVFGVVKMVEDYTVYEAGGEVKVVDAVLYGFSKAMLVFFVLMILAIAIYVYIFFLELGKFEIGPSFLRKMRFELETIAVVVLTFVCLVFVYYHNTLAVDLLGMTYFSSEKTDFLANGLNFVQQYSHTSIAIHLTWAPGYILMYLTTILALVVYIDRYYLSGVLNLSNYWRLRGHLLFIMFFALGFPLAEASLSGSFNVWTSLFSITYYGNVVIVSPASMSFLVAFITIVLMFLVFIFGTTLWPSKHVVKAEPFITLALPDEEILRRHKALPVALAWKRMFDWVLSIMAFFAIAFLYVGIVKELGSFYIVVWYREHMGLLWTTPSAYIVVICLLIQALIALKPTK